MEYGTKLVVYSFFHQTLSTILPSNYLLSTTKLSLIEMPVMLIDSNSTNKPNHN